MPLVIHNVRRSIRDTSLASRLVNLSVVLLPLDLVASLAAACTGGSGSTPTLLPTVPAVPVAASPAPIPPQATAATSQALAAFVRFYFEQLNVAFSSSDASIIRRYSDPACGACNNYAKALVRRFGDGRWSEFFMRLSPEASSLCGRFRRWVRGVGINVGTVRRWGNRVLERIRRGACWEAAH
jgi:hypothetical protein